MRSGTACIGRRVLLGLGASVLAGCALGGRSSGADEGGTDAGSVGETTIAPDDEHVRTIGRIFREDGVLWLPQSGSAVEFEVRDAVLVALEVVGDENVGNAPDLRPRFAVLVDGEVVVDDTLGEASRLVEVPLHDPATGAVVQLMHLSEANRGWVGLRGITVASDAAESVTATEAKDLRLAFVGDSITCAYGVEATSNDGPYQTTTQNFMKSYAYLVAQEFDADIEAVCYSGYGVVSGWSADGNRNGGMLLPPVYELVAEGTEQTWDFAAHPSDVVVVNLGTNDVTYTGTDEGRMREFAQGYAALLDRIRECNPEALIMCTLGTMSSSEALYPALEQGVEDHARRAEDARVLCYLSEPIDEATERVVLNGHPDEEGQRKIARQLANVLREQLS